MQGYPPPCHFVLSHHGQNLSARRRREPEASDTVSVARAPPLGSTRRTPIVHPHRLQQPRDGLLCSTASTSIAILAPLPHARTPTPDLSDSKLSTILNRLVFGLRAPNAVSTDAAVYLAAPPPRASPIHSSLCARITLIMFFLKLTTSPALILAD